MSTTKKNVLFTGATGYIGGSVLARLLEHPKASDFDITTVVRSPEKAEKLSALGVTTVVGSHSDEALMERLASSADIVIATANADDMPAAKSTLRGLKKRYQQTNIPAILIHTSGTGVLGDDAAGLYAGDVIYDDSDPDQIETLPPTRIHRDVDLELVAADKEGYVKTYIVLPSTIYGIAKHQLGDLGISNVHSIQIPHLVKVSLARSQAGMVGQGANIWPNVNIDDVADLYITLLDAVLADNPDAKHGREGFYFGENGEHTLYQIGKEIGAALVELGVSQDPEPTSFTQDELNKHFWGSTYMGSNSRCRAHRARLLGWNPKNTTQDMLKSIKPEVSVLRAKLSN